MNKLLVSSPHPSSGIRLLKKHKIPTSHIQHDYINTLIETQKFHHDFWKNNNILYENSQVSDSEFLFQSRLRHMNYYKSWIKLNLKLVTLGYLDFFSEIRYSYRPIKFIGFRTQGITVR